MVGVLVNDDADLDMVQRAAVFACVGTAGQRCTTTRRIVEYLLFLFVFFVVCVCVWKLDNIIFIIIIAIYYFCCHYYIFADYGDAFTKVLS